MLAWLAEGLGVPASAPHKLGVVAHTYNPCTWEVEAVESEVQSYPCWYSKLPPAVSIQAKCSATPGVSTSRSYSHTCAINVQANCLTTLGL